VLSLATATKLNCNPKTNAIAENAPEDDVLEQCKELGKKLAEAV